MRYKFVSVIIPCRNEIMFIKCLLDNLLKQDYSKEYLEIFFIDGQSNDGTSEIIKDYAQHYEFINYLVNINLTVPYALNLGIRSAKGDVIIRLDAHSVYPIDYFSKLVYYLEYLNADNVGGIWITKAYNNSFKSQAIAEVTSNILGVGDATYRLGCDKICEVDTVPFGCYRREIFDKIGFFDEQLVRNQDDEFNARLKKNGGRIFLIPSIKIIYYSRESINKAFKMFFQYGLFKPLVNIKVKKPSTLRQFVPFLFVIYLILFPLMSFLLHRYILIYSIGIFLYFLLTVIFSIIISFKKQNFLLSPILVYCFFIVHVSYGLGYLKGIVDFFILKKHKKKKIKDINISR